MAYGMPVWSVSEPYVSLWLRDEPLGYQPATGPAVALNLSYKQRETTAGLVQNFFSVGRKWNFSWFSYVLEDDSQNKTVHWGEGMQRIFQGTNDYLTNDRITGDSTNGFTVLYPDGSKDVYGFIVTNASGVFEEAFLTEKWNERSQKSTLIYAAYTPSDIPVVRLQYVVDGDGRTNTIYYVNSNPFSTNLIDKVVDAFGRTNSYAYDSGGRLTNITDVLGISTSFAYDANGWVTNMTTPYGSTAFAFTDTVSGDTAPNGRSVLITQPDGGHQLYFYTNSAPGVVGAYPTNQVPTTFPFPNTLETNALNVRNSFYWGPRQYANLSVTTVGAFSTNDYRLARMKHWLKSDSMAVIETLSLEREPTPDDGGAVEGQKTWYDYAGKTNISYPGSQVEPLFIAKVLPDGSSQFIRSARNSFGAATNEINTYSVTAGGPVLLRTNIYVYDVDGINLLAKVNALGVQVLSNIYNGFHEVVTNYNALNEITIYAYDDTQRLASVVAPTGLVTTNVYGSDGFLAQQIAVGISTNSYTYAKGLVVSQTDSRGLTVSNTWDNLQRLLKVSYPDGTFATNIYNNLDLVRTIDRMGFTNSFGFDPMRRKIAETNALGAVTLYNYCTCGSLDSVQNAAGKITYFDYDNAGRQVATVFPDLYCVTNEINLLGQITNTVDSSGISMTNWYNNQGLVVGVSNAFGRVRSSTFDILDRPTNSVDVNGVNIAMTYDSLNRLRTRAYPDSGTESFGYSPNISGMTSYTNQLNLVTYFGYDAAGRKTSETNANTEITSFTYSGANDLLTLTDGKSQITSWGYDTFGRVTNKVDAAANLIFVYSYDPDNRLTNRWTPAKGNTIYKYDRVGNLTNIVYALSHSISMAYDVLNQITNMVDASGSTVFNYDSVGQLLAEDGPWPADTVSYVYQNRLRTALAVLAPSASSWTQSYGYDAARRLRTINSPAGGFTYTLGGASFGSPLTKKLLLPNGAYITNTYDNVARLTGTLLDNSSDVVLNSHQYTYNTGNQRTEQVFTAGNFTDYTYDNIGQLQTAIGKESGGLTNRLNEQFGYVYDAAGNLNFRTNNALVQTFGVNNLNELSTVSRAGTLTVEGVTTSPATNVTVNTSNAVLYADSTFAATNFTAGYGDNTFTAIARDHYGRTDTNVSRVSLPGTNSYSYDLNGNLLSDGSRYFEYDDENELVRVTVTNLYESRFTYDGRMRRRVTRDYTWNADSSGAGTWVTSVSTTSPRNNFTGWVGLRFTVGDTAMVVTSLGRWVISGSGDTHVVKLVGSDGIDVSGGAVTVDSSSISDQDVFLYAALPQPITLAAHSTYYLMSSETSGGDEFYDLGNTYATTGAASGAGAAWTFGGQTYNVLSSGSVNYGPLDLQYTTAGSWTFTKETRYLYDGNLVVQERDQNNIPQVSYTRGTDLSGTLQGLGGIGGLLARTENPLMLSSQPSTTFYHVDGNGNITALINPTQLIVAKYSYDAFGEILVKVGPMAHRNAYQFSSKEYDCNSGMNYFLYRFYDPVLQRWINRDSIAERGGVNLYRFVKNNSLSAVDPNGRNPLVAGGAVIVVGGAAAYVGLCINRFACRRHRDLTLGLAEAQADANAPDGSTHRGAGASAGNDADMLTHCIASCEMARHPGPCGGPDRALDFMQEREIGNDPATQIDRLNNETGIGVGVSPQWTGQTCTAACLDALNRGLLTTIRNGVPAASPPRM
jgi:RHS repeat-associated protein